MKLHVLICAVAMNALTATSSQAALITFYGNGTDADAAALLNVAPPVAGVTVSNLSDLGAQTGDPTRITRPSFGSPTPAGPTAGSSAGSEWLEARSLENQGAPSSTDNYFVFTAMADPGSLIDLTSLKYDFYVHPNDGTTTEADAEAFISIDGGTFLSVGSINSIDNDGSASAVVAPSSADFDLSALSLAEAVEVRIGIGYSSGNSGGISGFIQGIQLDGDVVAIPEPSSFLSMTIVGMVIGAVRRRR